MFIVQYFFIPLRVYKRFRFIIFLGGIALFVSVLVFGEKINGSKRWLSLGPLNIHVFEFGKVCVLIMWSAFLAKNFPKANFGSLRFMLVFLVLVGIPSFLVFLAPDFSSSFVLVVVCLALCFDQKVPFSYFATTLLSVILLVLVYMVVDMSTGGGYQVSRLESFIQGFGQSLQDEHYQVLRSKLAIIRGGFFGEGYGASILKHLYLPEPHNDFILSIAFEEFGFVPVVFFVFLYSVFLIGLLKIVTDRSSGRFALAFGQGLWLFLSANFCINLAVVANLIPVTGVSLPFVSYGGSNLLVSVFSVAIILRLNQKPHLHKQHELR